MFRQFISPGQQASIYASGYMLILLLGMISSVALVIGALWLVVQFVALLLTSIVSTLTTIGQTYQAADPFVRFLILIAIGFVMYRTVRHFRQQGRGNSHV